ncbi:glycosyl hydrolase family 5 protein-like protein/cellulase [Lindgomyces ingoldianus]|uniref:Glycosyl hydrolase family 5 protein-like protein/cellulase n=1 Tax=Lindgomyces ingoldianus TaxID=673940 RepID=A0ACB6RBN0_9PLEO|nr:glycosyl hydrolase family 5 protein-like protein/cellulase [Lindgomyces ingoldianus]KAF2475745.1 glycosyl hydrolase family 5 protein-like protein/cellulase [Lindgomyces ingoldianus]
MHHLVLLFILTYPSLLFGFPSVPFKSSKRWVVDSTGTNFTYIGVNWPGAADVMIPEGLQYASIRSIVSKIKSLKMNVIRLTFAIEMVDDIKDNGGDVTIQQAFSKALGSKGDAVYQQVLKSNPQFNASTTRLQVFDAVAAECANQGIYVHLDNHMSKGAWCCSTNDGNAWFGDTYFNADKWKRGLQYMAEHVSLTDFPLLQTKNWSNMISIGLRNEFRKPEKAGSSQAYNWQIWYSQMVAAADLVNAANPDILIFLSGLDFDTTLSPIPGASDLGGGKKFQRASFKYADKLVLELHNYQNSATSCDSMKSGLWNNGFKALDASAINQMPVVLTEFGYQQTDSSYNGVYASCLRKIVPEWDAGWTIWVLAGSYYIRSGTQDYEETWGLMNHKWTDWRSANAIKGLQEMIDASLG